MEARIQTILDAQWDALETRNKNVKKIRVELSDALEELANERFKDINLIDDKIREENKKLENAVHVEAYRLELESKLNKEANGELCIQSNELSAQISDLDKQIAELVAKRTQLDAERQRVDSIVSSRTARYKDAIADLDRKSPKDKHISSDVLKRQINENLSRRELFNTEYGAACDGRDLWEEVRKELINLDKEIAGLRRSQLPQISFILTKASNNVEKHLETASQAGWSALVVAIGHELQILHDTLLTIQEVELKDQ